MCTVLNARRYDLVYCGGIVTMDCLPSLSRCLVACGRGAARAAGKCAWKFAQLTVKLYHRYRLAVLGKNIALKRLQRDGLESKLAADREIVRKAGIAQQQGATDEAT